MDDVTQIIASNDNLNNYTSTGQYKTDSAAVSATIENTPYKKSGYKLTVEYLSNKSHIMQIIKAVNAPYVYYRTGNKSNDTWNWNAWNQIITNADILYQRGITTTLTVEAMNMVETEVVFPKSFSNIPAISVYANWTSAGDKRYARITTASKTSFKVAVVNNVNQVWNPQITWVASGSQ